MPRPLRAACLVDGFNLYHSLEDAQHQLHGKTTKWLDLRSLILSYMGSIEPRATLEMVIYFSAYAGYRDATRPGHTKRHRKYVECLKNTGVDIELGRFKRSDARCRLCHKKYIRHEEKETDVAISVRLTELAFTSPMDVLILLSGDSDLTPALRTVRNVNRAVRLAVVFPFRRSSDDLKRAADATFSIKAKRYLGHQFPDPVCLPDGREIAKPSHW